MITKQEVIDSCRQVFDPEIQVDIYTLGLIYDIEVVEDEIKIIMTYTTPLCPFGDRIQQSLRNKLQQLNPRDIKITVTFEPQWQASQELRDLLGV